MRDPQPQTPTSARISTLGQRLLALVEGDLASLPPRERARLITWQENRTRAALGHMLSLLAAIAIGKVMLVLTGVWPAGLPLWLHFTALLVLLFGRWGYKRAGGLASEASAALLFMLGLITILADPAPEWWIEQPGLTLGWVWLLAALGIPLLARLGSVVVFCGVLVTAAALFFALVPGDARQTVAILLYLLVSIAGGLLLRRLRSDMSLDYRRSTESVTHAANTDALTGLRNRRGWREHAPLLLAEHASNKTPLSLLFIDLDHFKLRNDRQGHAAGDEALHRVGQLLAERLGVGLAARLGGEEFVCLLPGLDENAALLFAHSLREPLSQDPDDPLTFSGGIAQWRPGEDISELLARGDAAMYRAKQAGRDRVMPAS
ncbi:MAG: GGDEF domain-containing protein [Thermomonas sp.]